MSVESENKTTQKWKIKTRQKLLFKYQAIINPILRDFKMTEFC